MDFRKREANFQEADRRYAELMRQRDAGSISDEELDVQLRRLIVQDDEGRWWAKSRKTGEWNYYDGSAWVRATPPGYQQPPPPPTLLAESTPDHHSQPEQSERLPSSQATLPDSAPAQDQDRGKQLRGVPRWAVRAAGLVVIAALIGIGIIIEWPSRTAAGYDLVKDDTGNLSVEVPSEWKARSTTESQGEKGRNWSSFLGENAGPSLAAVNDFYAWASGARPHKGTYVLASKELAQSYTDDELVALGPNDYSASCEAGVRQDFERPPYSGRMQEWNNCGGESDHRAITLSAAPEGRECVVLLQIGGYLQGEEENIRHILETFEANCRRIA